MFEWLRTILGDSYTEDIDKKVAEEIGKGFVAKADFNTLKEGKKALENQLTEAGKTIEGFKELDVDSIRKEADSWKEKAEQAETAAATKIAQLEFDNLLDSAISKVGGRSLKAVRAELDMDSLQGSKNQASDIQAALEALKSESDYLFANPSTPPPMAAGTGGSPIGGSSPEMAAIRAAAGLKTE